MARIRSRRGIDLLLVAVFAPIWLVCLVLHLDLQAKERMAWFAVYVEPANDGMSFPEFRAYWPGVPQDDRTLEASDRLVQLGTTRLQGASRLRVLESAYASADVDQQVHALVERNGRTLTVEIPLLAHSFPWRTVPLAVGLGLAAFFALVRGQGRRSARAFALGALMYSFHWLLQFGGPPWQTQLGLALTSLSAAAFLPLTLQAALEIPERLVPRQQPPARWVWVFAVVGVFNLSWLLDVPLRGELGVRLLVLTYVAFIVALLFILARNYRDANAKGRRQLKWVILGFWIGLGPSLLGGVATVLDPSLRWFYELCLVTTPAIPICILIAIVKEAFLDIDRILTTTLVYSVLVPIGLGTFVTLGSSFADRLTSDAGLERTTGLWIAVVLIAALFQPLSRFAHPFFEKVVAADQMRVRAALRSLRKELQLEENPGAILNAAGKRLTEVLELECCVLYAQTDVALAPIFATGPYSPPSIPRDGAFVHALATCEGSIRRSHWRKWLKRQVIEPVEAAALDTLGTRLVVPIRRGDDFFGLLCIGEKLSGDMFTPAEIVLIDLVADQVSQQLDHVDRARLDEEARRLNEQVSGYLPSAVVAEIQRGGDVELGEVEVSILFVDIRGYSKLSETRSAQEIFELTNDYTRIVSSVIEAHSGVVVEFQGDGLMAIFGAPAILPDREKSAVRATRAILESMATHSFGDVAAGELSVGLGIATGPAFVGSIQAAGQKVWSAMGNTPNFASRLEGLTRNLNASIVIDETTHGRIQAESGGFERYDGIAVKGREEAFTVYALPLSA